MIAVKPILFFLRVAPFIEHAACHAKPFTRSGVLIASTTDAAPTTRARRWSAETCDYCASPRSSGENASSICANCRQINKSCADL